MLLKRGEAYIYQMPQATGLESANSSTSIPSMTKSTSRDRKQRQEGGSIVVLVDMTFPEAPGRAVRGYKIVVRHRIHMLTLCNQMETDLNERQAHGVLRPIQK